VLYAHPAVVDAAVAGIPHDVLGEDVGAWVVLSEGSDTSAADLRAFLLERLADYKVPRQLHFIDQLPRNASGKVIKSELATTGPAGKSPRPME
jgi:long-chain acyl-CoA synthetase